MKVITKKKKKINSQKRVVVLPKILGLYLF